MEPFRSHRSLLAASLVLASALTAGCGMMRHDSPSASTSSAGAASALNSVDRTFSATAAGNGMYEVDVSRLATRRAASTQVRQYAQMLVDHHTMANNELMGILQRKGMAPSAALPSDKRAKMERLSALQASEFDRQYIRTVGIEDHTADIALFERETREGADPDLKAFAAKTLPTLRSHLQAAQAMPASMQ